MPSLKELKKKVWKCNMELWKNNLVVCTFGNVSGIDRKKGIVAIKPSGVPYSELTPDKIVLVDLDNKVVDDRVGLDDRYKPSSDTRSHIVLYRNFPNIGGVVHTHSPYATAWAQAKMPIPCFGTTHADYVRGNIPCTDDLSDKQIKGDYEKETGIQIVKTFGKLSLSCENTEMVIVASHGPFTWGETPEKAVYNSIMLEEIAKIAYFTADINRKVKPIKRTLLGKHFFRKHGKNAYYGQNRKKADIKK